MSKITLTFQDYASIMDGKHVTFRAPCDSTGITGIVINHDTYELKDMYNNDIGNSNSMAFKAGAMVYVILDATNHVAYLQNSSGVESFNGRFGAIEPQSGDYTYEMVGAAPTEHTHGAKDITGVLSQEHGGTGYDNILDFIDSLDGKLFARFG